MPDLTGFELIDSLPNPPMVIIISAYPEYALEGFDLDIADYLVKPISFQRFTKSVGKAMELCQFSKQIENGSENTQSKPDSDFFFVKFSLSFSHSYLIFLEDIQNLHGTYGSIHSILKLTSMRCLIAESKSQNNSKRHASGQITHKVIISSKQNL